MPRWWLSLLLATGGLGCGTSDDQRCTAQDQSACRTAIERLHAEVASCKAADVCVVVKTGLQGSPKWLSTFSCSFVVRGDVDLAALSGRVAAISTANCDACEAMYPPVPCFTPPPTVAARCNLGTGLCEASTQ
jgi:hypothetical protein